MRPTMPRATPKARSCATKDCRCTPSTARLRAVICARATPDCSTSARAPAILSRNLPARSACARAHPALRLYAELAAIPQSIAFDAIVFRGTLQYMPDLHAVAAWCSERLRSGGHLFILATPNAESILAQMQREQWVLANKAEHRYWFTRRHLLRLFGDRFALVACDLPYLGTPYEDYGNDLAKVLAMIENPQTRADRPGGAHFHHLRHHASAGDPASTSAPAGDAGLSHLVPDGK